MEEMVSGKAGFPDGTSANGGTDKFQKQYTFLLALSLTLLLSLAVMGYYLYKMHNQLTELGRQQRAPIAQNPDQVAANTQEAKNQKTGSPTTTKPFSALDELAVEEISPFTDMQRLHERINQMFGSTWFRFHELPAFEKLPGMHTYSASLDLQETDTEFIIRADIPGTDESEINITFENGIVTIEGVTERTTGNTANSGSSLTQEHFVGQFRRSLTLPGPVDSSKMQSTYVDGVLVIHIPKVDDNEIAP